MFKIQMHSIVINSCVGMKAGFSTCYEEPQNNLVIESVPFVLKEWPQLAYFDIYIFLSSYKGINGDSNWFVP